MKIRYQADNDLSKIKDTGPRDIGQLRIHSRQSAEGVARAISLG